MEVVEDDLKREYASQCQSTRTSVSTSTLYYEQVGERVTIVNWYTPLICLWVKDLPFNLFSVINTDNSIKYLLQKIMKIYIELKMNWQASFYWICDAVLYALL